MFAFLERLRWLKSKVTPTLPANECGITTLTREGAAERFTWKDIRKVTIVTTDQGPWSEDIFFVVEAVGGTIVFPHEQAVKTELLTYLQKLPGFDNEAVIRAMSCTGNNAFPCWSAAGSR